MEYIWFFFGNIKIFLNKCHMLNKAAFIWLEIQ